jgi:hypothetical protein
MKYALGCPHQSLKNQLINKSLRAYITTDPEVIFEHLGAESKRLWGKLNDFWKNVKTSLSCS